MRDCVVRVRVCVERECVQMCNVFTSGVCTRSVCKGVCVRECVERVFPRGV